MCLVLLDTVGCTSLAHAQRSAMQKVDGNLFTFRCALGNSKQGGFRLLFQWITPRFLKRTVDVLGPLKEFLATLASRNSEEDKQRPCLLSSLSKGGGVWLSLDTFAIACLPIILLI